MHARSAGDKDKGAELSVAEAMHRLHETIPCADSLRHRPEALVEYGDGEAGAQIVEVAKRKKADLIVMGIRAAGACLPRPTSRLARHTTSSPRRPARY